MTIRRSAVSSAGVAFVLIVLAMVAGGYALYQQASAPNAAIFISTRDCSTISYQVVNQDSRILSGWRVEVVVSPTDSNIMVNPDMAGVAALAPRGSVNGTVSIAYGSGTPVGTYQIKANLVNGTNTIASSSSLPCTIK